MLAERIALSSAAAGPTEAKRLARWCEEYFESYGGVEITAVWDAPCAIHLKYLTLGAFGLRAERAGSISRFHRHRERVSRDGDDRFTLIINRGNSATQRITPSQSTTLPVGSSILFDRSEASTHVCAEGSNRLVLISPRRQMLAALPNCEDLVGTAIPAGNEAIRLLAYYADGLLDDPQVSDPAVLAQAGQSLMDLAGLAFGTNRDNAEVARQRGLRAARLAAVLRRIRLDFADPEISPEAVARRVGISTRYLHNLLQETGSSFTERVLELRLAKALAQIDGSQGIARKVSDAAYDAGFNDLSYFNRCFRRRYGLTPTAARNSGLACA